MVSIKWARRPYYTLLSCCNIINSRKHKVLKQLESGFKRTINWNKYLSETINQAQNRYLDYLIDPSLQGVNGLFVLSFENDNGRESHRQYYFLTVEIKDYVMIDGRYFFDQPIKSDLKTYDSINKIATGQCDDYTTGCLLDYPYSKKYYKLIAIDLSKQQKLDADPKSIEQILLAIYIEQEVQQCFSLLKK